MNKRDRRLATEQEMLVFGASTSGARVRHAHSSVFRTEALLRVSMVSEGGLEPPARQEPEGRLSDSLISA